MMGDPGPSDIPMLPSFLGNQFRHDFPGQVLPISGLQPSVPTSSADLYPRPLPYFQPLDHHPSVSFRTSIEIHGKRPVLEHEVGLVHPPKPQEQEGLPKLVKETKSKKWKESETLILLECMVGGGDFVKGKQGAMHWDRIVGEINAKNIGGPLRSKEQCQNRFDTLLKAYKDLNAYCLRIGKEFCNVTEDEKRSLKLAMPLAAKHDVWYNHLHTIHVQRSSLRGESHKRQKCDLEGGIDVNKHVSSSLDTSVQSAPPLDLNGSSKSMNRSSREVVVSKFNALNVALRYTFLNLIQVCSIGMISRNDYGNLSLEVLCRLLAIVQDQNPLEIRNHVYQLRDLKLVTFLDVDYHEDYGLGWEDCWIDKKWLDTSNLEAYKKLVSKLLSKNPHLNYFYKASCSALPGTELYLFQQIRVLILCKCQELEKVDLGNFPNLRCLNIKHCWKLKVVDGWEAAKRLGWIEIQECFSYFSIPSVQFLFSLKEFCFGNSGRQRMPWQLANFSQCVQLQRLEICNDNVLVESMDLKALRFLEVLSFSWCRALSTIHGLSALPTLIKLNLIGCESLKTLPSLGCLKALTYLNISYSGIVDIPGVRELHLLTSLDLYGCKSLESLPPLGHLKALAHLDVSMSGIEEILGVEDLVSLETLDCCGSELKRLPNLDHLRLLHKIDVYDTPLSRMDPSRSFVGGYELIYNDRKKEGVFVDDISDMISSEDISCNED